MGWYRVGQLRSWEQEIVTDSTKKHPPESNDLRARLGMKSPAASSQPPHETSEGSVGNDPFVNPPFEKKDTLSDKPGGSFYPDVQVPDLSRTRPWIWVGLVVVALVAFGVGALFGNVADQRSKRSESNRQAAQFVKDLDKQGAQIARANEFFQKVRAQLEISDSTMAGSSKDLLYQLQTMSWQELDGSREVAFARVAGTDFGPSLVHDFINYYKLLEQLHQQFSEFSQEMSHHVEALVERAQVLRENQNPVVTIKKEDKKEAATDGFGLSLVESEKIPLAKLVEVLGQQCKKLEPTGRCAPQNKEISFRMDVNGTVFKRPMSLEDGGVVPIVPTVLFQKLIVGSPRQLAYDRFKSLETQILQSHEAWKHAQQVLKKKLQERAK